MRQELSDNRNLIKVLCYHLTHITLHSPLVRRIGQGPGPPGRHPTREERRVMWRGRDVKRRLISVSLHPPPLSLHITPVPFPTFTLLLHSCLRPAGYTRPFGRTGRDTRGEGDEWTKRTEHVRRMPVAYRSFPFLVISSLILHSLPPSPHSFLPRLVRSGVECDETMRGTVRNDNTT